MSESALEKYLAVNPLVPHTEKTITTQEKLIRRWNRSRQVGYGVEDEELGLGVCAVSTPIYNRSGQLFGTVGATGLAVALREQNAEVVAALKSLSQEISRQVF